MSWPFRASFAHFDALARFCSSHRCPSASVKDRRPECPSRSVHVFISFSDDSVLRAIGVDHSPVSRRHLWQLLAYRPIAHRARHSGAAAVAGILPVARAVPWFVGMVFTYPTRPARKPRILMFPYHHAFSLFLFRRLWNSK